jgi:hypothetical protein
MSYVFNGLPLHPLVVHAVVVLLPLAVVGTIAIAVRPVWRRRYGHLVVACAAVATALIPVATQSGKALEKQVGSPGQHAHLGDQLIWFAIPLLLLSLVLVVLDRRATTTNGTRHSSRPRFLTVVAVLAIMASLACGVQVYRVGDSGARAAWGNRIAAR